MTPLPSQMPELKPCPFERGQVWENPDNEIMMVINTRREMDAYKVNYVSEDGEYGSFWDTNRAIIDNITQVNTRAASVPSAKCLICVNFASPDTCLCDTCGKQADGALGSPSDKERADTVDKAYIFLCNKLNEYQAKDSSRPASFYTELKPSMLWAVEYLAREGYLNTAPAQSDTIKVLVEALQKISAGTVDTNIKDQKDMYLHAFMEQSEIAYEALALAEKGGV